MINTKIYIEINAKDHLAAIAFSMAELQLELGQKQAAIESLKDAKIAANKIEDKAFKVEIDELLSSVTNDYNAQ